jgi:hypothetical protein
MNKAFDQGGQTLSPYYISYIVYKIIYGMSNKYVNIHHLVVDTSYPLQILWHWL